MLFWLKYKDIFLEKKLYKYFYFYDCMICFCLVRQCGCERYFSAVEKTKAG